MRRSPGPFPIAWRRRLADDQGESRKRDVIGALRSRQPQCSGLARAHAGKLYNTASSKLFECLQPAPVSPGPTKYPMRIRPQVRRWTPTLRSAFLLMSASAAALWSSGCATITRGVHEALVVESQPAGATVTLSTGDTGTTPTSFRIRRRGALDVTISKPGFEVIHVHVSTQIAGWGAAGMAGNVLVGGVIGVGVDAFSGGTLEHKPNPISVTLVPLKAETTPAPTEAIPPPPTPPTSPPPANPAPPVPPSASPPAVAPPEPSATPAPSPAKAQ